MKLAKLTIKNFKSLADVAITPSDLTVIIGPNGSGKTNLANAFAFLKEVYANGLETAIQRSGGFDNIAQVQSKKSRPVVEFSITYILSTSEFYDQAGVLLEKRLDRDSLKSKEDFLKKVNSSELLLTHSFSLQATGKNISSNYSILHESFFIEDKISRILSYEKKQNKEFVTEIDENKITVSDIFSSVEAFVYLYKGKVQDLFVQNFPVDYLFKDAQTNISNWAIYQLFPNSTKTAGVPTPNPTLSLYGENLPVLVDYMKKREKDIWKNILSSMQKVVPLLTDISTGYLYNKTMGLFFHEEGISRPWNAEEVSDGTILTLAMLCSVNDPRNTLVFIEEPENSLHPWVLRELLQNFKKIAKEKPIIVTTHSPTLIDMVSPSEIWCISKNGRETHLNRLTDIATELQLDWEEGRYKISDYLDSGLVPQAIPGGSI